MLKGHTTQTISITEINNKSGVIDLNVLAVSIFKKKKQYKTFHNWNHFPFAEKF